MQKGPCPGWPSAPGNVKQAHPGSLIALSECAGNDPASLIGSDRGTLSLAQHVVPVLRVGRGEQLGTAEIAGFWGLLSFAYSLNLCSLVK